MRDKIQKKLERVKKHTGGFVQEFKSFALKKNV